MPTCGIFLDDAPDEPKPSPAPAPAGDTVHIVFVSGKRGEYPTFGVFRSREAASAHRERIGDRPDLLIVQQQAVIQE